MADETLSRPKPFAHLNAVNAGLYRRIMGAFATAKRRFTVHLRPEDVQHHLRVSGGQTPEYAAVVDALTQLCEWGNLRADPDTSRVTTVEEFHRARFLYQLTREGEAAEEALATYDAALGRRGALQSVALADIVVHLRALLELAGADEVDTARIHLSLTALAARFQDLADNAQAFMGSLQRTIELQDVEVEAFLAYKDRLIEYLERFIKDLVATGAEIAQLVLELEDCGVPTLLDAAADRESADAAPDGTEDFREREFARCRALWADRWAGFHAWFISVQGHASQAAILRSQARAAVPRMLAVVAALNDRRAGRSDRSADFHTLARWFAQAPDDASMHRLWRAAFGLQSSRHLTADADTLTAREEQPVAASTSWADAPAMVISPRLRKTGRYERRGRPNRVVDRSAQRHYLAELAAKEAEQAAAARDALVAVAGSPIRLSDVGHLDAGAFQLFLRLLGDALASKTPGRAEVETVTSDGSLSLRLVELPGPAMAEIETGAGVFRGPDHLLHIEDLTDVVRREAAS
ncbi:TIGR02677 family protein [Nocardia amamiensis]|uniref:TIGR02677 family protein n=1 Tax=Nocardia amamiensis TaxID=404578 RepID=UPI00082CC95E|nr:TIGR02677 family protein [Nocardia amamiensis]